jgi:hypothetical protein
MARALPGEVAAQLESLQVRVIQKYMPAFKYFAGGWLKVFQVFTLQAAIDKMEGTLKPLLGLSAKQLDTEVRCLLAAKLCRCLITTRSQLPDSSAEHSSYALALALTYLQMDPFQRAQVHLTVAKAFNTLFLVYLKAKGVDPEEYPVQKELVCGQPACNNATFHTVIATER